MVEGRGEEEEEEGEREGRRGRGKVCTCVMVVVVVVVRTWCCCVVVCCCGCGRWSGSHEWLNDKASLSWRVRTMHLSGWQNTWEQAPGVPATPSPP